MFEIKNDNYSEVPKITVIGVGGGGNNALDRMINSNLLGVNYIAVNTDVHVLGACKANVKIQIGKKITKGYGAGADSEVGEMSALESEDEIREAIADEDMCVLTCGMGGGTGTGAIPVIAKCCKDAGILTVAVVTTPFSFENTPRIKVAENGIEKLKEYVDTLFIIPNDKLLELSEKRLLLEDAFEFADSVLKYTIESITNIVSHKGTVNLDFNDLKTTLTGKGVGHLGIGTVDAETPILEAVKQAINSPLLETSIEGAETILINTSGKVDIISLYEAMNYVKEVAGDDVYIIWGTVKEDDVDNDKIIVTLIATGMEKKQATNPLTAKTLMGDFRINESKRPIEEQEIGIAVPPFLRDSISRHERKKSR